MADLELRREHQRRMVRNGHDEKCLACADPERWVHDEIDPPGSKPRRMVRVPARP